MLSGSERYVDEHLTEDDAPGEDVVLRLHRHGVLLLRPALLFLLVIAGAGFAEGLASRGLPQPAAGLAVAAAALLLLLVLVLPPVLSWCGSSVEVTTHRLVVRRGTLGRTGRDVPWGRVRDVSFRQTAVQRLVRAGTVVVDTTGGGHPVVLEDVPDPVGLQRLLQELVQQDADGRWDDPRWETAVTGEVDGSS